MKQQYIRLQTELQQLSAEGNLRTLPTMTHSGAWIKQGDNTMLNLSSNDYLGLAGDTALRREFMDTTAIDKLPFTASSSRLLTGNHNVYATLETRLAQLFHREAALVFNCGYHANTGILPAISDANTLILADKWVHASLIDGLRLSAGKHIRYRHNDYDQLERLVAAEHSHYQQIILVVESVYSMDGDVTDLPRLVDLKKRYPNVWLYVDEAHGFGVFGDNGLGVAEARGCMADIDFLVGTFGKALASVGAYIVCDEVVRNYLINRMRTLIFTTALPPVNIAWTNFLLHKLPDWKDKRKALHDFSRQFADEVRQFTGTCDSASQIVPWLTGDSRKASLLAEWMQRKGYFVLPVRPPTVPAGTSRLRFSLTAAIAEDKVLARHLLDTLKELHHYATILSL